MSIQSIIKTEKRNRLYHDRFRYALNFTLSDIYMIRELPGAEKLQFWIDRRFESQRKNNREFYGQMTQEKAAALHGMQNFLLGLEHPFKFMVSFEQGWVYTSSLKELEELYHFLADDKIYYTWKARNIREAIVVGRTDVIALRKPKYSIRMYLRDRKVVDEQREQLSAWLENHAQNLAASKGLDSWLHAYTWRSSYMQRYFYIDCNDSAYQTLFAMTFPGLFRKAVPIVAK